MVLTTNFSSCYTPLVMGTIQKMSSLNSTLAIILLTQVLAEGTVHHQLILLNKLIQKIDNEQRIQNLIILQHHQDTNCMLQDWNPGMLTLRANEWTKIPVRKNFNHFALALVCMENGFEIDLLNTLATIYYNMRSARIVLWTQGNPSKEFLDKVITQASEHKFSQLIVLDMGDDSSGPLSSYRLNLYPYSHFDHIENPLRVQGGVFSGRVNYYGMTAIIKTPDKNFHMDLNNPTEVIPISQIEYIEVFLFARHSNLKLKTLEGNSSGSEYFDIQLGKRFININNSVSHLGYVSPFSSSSLILVVPCGHEMSLRQVFHQLGVRTWLLYILYLYITLVLVETLILVVTWRIRNQPHRLTRLGAWVNLRAFRALLGMSFPISPRATLSLRQLFVAMSVFGMVFSCFFSCKLSDLLTKHPYQGQVSNFQELRDSGLTVIVDPEVRSSIESELDAHFFHRVIPLAKSLPHFERLKMMFSLNDSYGYIIFKENMHHLNYHQQSLSRKAFCTSKELSIIDNMPRVYGLQENSIFMWPLSRFELLIQEAGISQEWKKRVYRNANNIFNLTNARTAEVMAIPLSFEDLKWLAYLLILGYGAATIVFIAEVLLGNPREAYRGHEAEV